MIDVIKWCERNLSKNDTYVDIGAHIGMIALPVIASCNPRKSILVEADSRAFQLLKNNVDSFLSTEPVAIYNLLVTDKIGVDTLFLDINAARSSMFRGGDGIEIKSITLDELLKDDNNLVIKMDVEMAEPLVWRGMKNILDKIKAICMEFMPNHLASSTSFNPNLFIEEIRADGFDVLSLDGNQISERELFNPNGQKVDIFLKRL